jgi:tetratricopeptide (TPR) repeat protein
VDPERFARFAEVASRLRERCRTTPTMILIDDVHAADDGVLLLTRFVARMLDGLPLVLVLSRRDAGVPGSEHEELLADLERDATAVPLRPFDLRETVALLSAHGFASADRSLAAALLRVTAGNPLLLARAAARGAPAGPAGAMSTVEGAATVGIAAGVEHAAEAALARLSRPALRAVGLMGVLGTTAAVRDLAALAGEPPASLLDVLGEAGVAGLVEPSPLGRLTFTHEIFRQAALSTLSPAERLDAHASVAAASADATIDGDSLDGLVRRAHHAVAAAARSDADADVAIDACRLAARAMMRGFDYERAVELLDSAASIAGQRPVRAEHAGLLVERAEAILAQGRLAAAREAFGRAADAAEAVGDRVAAARAALGLGGVWLNEHRDPVSRTRVLARQRTALSALPEREHTLRARLGMRLAAEAVYDGASLGPLFAALERSRSSGDEQALAEGLSLAHHALLTPHHTDMRLPIAQELVGVASAAGDGVLALMGLMWRTVDLYHLGEARAERSLAELRDRADALGCRSILYIVAAIDVMRLIRAGRFAEAEKAAGECLQLGTAVGDADATAYYAGQLISIRWMQGRDAELADLAPAAGASPTLLAGEFALRATAAVALARAGRLDEARLTVERLTGGPLTGLPVSSTWLSGMVTLIEAARLLKDASLARQAYELLQPFGSLPAMPSLAIACLGCVERSLGVAAQVMGELDAAVTHLDQALDGNRRLGNRPMAALSAADLAGALAVRAAPGDQDRAVSLLRHARAEAVAMELTGRAEEWGALLAKMRCADPGDEAARCVLTRRAAGWAMSVDGTEIVLPDLVGLRYLGILLTRPGDEVPALDLCAAGAVDRSRHEVLDGAALQAYRRRVRDLDVAVDEAEADADLGRAERLRFERDAVAEQLAHAVGLGGRTRAFASSHERARTSVRKAVKRALEAVEAADPRLGTELRESVTTGTTCRYAPDQRQPRRWNVQLG